MCPMWIPPYLGLCKKVYFETSQPLQHFVTSLVEQPPGRIRGEVA